MNYDQEANIAAQAQAYGKAAQGMGVAGGLANMKAQPIRERIQEANKRAKTLSGNLNLLLNMVRPALLANAGVADAEGKVRDSTMSTDVDDLSRNLARATSTLDQITSALLG